MGLKKRILFSLLAFLNLFFKHKHIKKNKILFISLTNDKLTSDFKLINDKLVKLEKYDIHYILVSYKNTLRDNFLYMLNCIKQLYEINTSSLVILNDNNYVISNFKKEGVRVLQVWHACGAIKKFGNQIKREYVIQNYDYVLATSNKWKSIYHEAFHVAENHVIVTGLPRVDSLSKQDQLQDYQKTMLKKYPIFKGKYIILYAPTFRGNIVHGFTYEPLDFDKMIESLNDNTLILYKMHPLLGDIKFSSNERIINVNGESLNALMAISDCLITDYSSIAFDYSLLNKKMIFYSPDLEVYKKNIGLNMDYENELPGEICKNEDELIHVLRKEKDEHENSSVKHFQELFMPYNDGNNCKRVVEFIERLFKTD